MSTTMRIIILLLMISTIIGNNFEGSIGLMGQFPKNEFKEQGVPTGLGVDFNGLIYPAPYIGFGLNLGYGEYGSSSRQIPFNYFSPGVTVEERTANAIGEAHLFFRIKPFYQLKIQPYIEGLVGLKHLSTKTTIESNNCADEDDNCDIAASTNASDIAFSWGGGFGLDILLTEKFGEKDQKCYFFINGRYLGGGEAKYLKEGGIILSDPALGPVTATYDWNNSRTDLLQISFGINLRFN